MTECFHRPVMVFETMSYLLPDSPSIHLDCTLGDGGHALEVLRRSRETFVLGFDVDSEALSVAGERLANEFGGRFLAVKADYRRLPEALAEIGVPRVDTILYDLGVSSRQLDTPERGFSYWGEGPLDMRMDPEAGITARDILMTYSGEELARILREYGEERFASRIAGEILKAREDRDIDSAGALVDIVKKAVPVRARTGGGHPARRTFQALRIAVNDEIGRLGRALLDGFYHLSAGGVMAVLSYHSLEDRVVKETFKNLAGRGEAQRVTRKPVTPKAEEIEKNPRARSAKLRVVKREMSHDRFI
ncbi:MAG: 16S rRNA (cytosine(1402)-N(4))-methyltransferase RsmH [Bacillota bacterium]|jgi:16S rRNA (cytosine1402-N4)-methyltransferase|nr:16S rRNA (cytosine(1402)-N(4))-methyltransferase RsmH [Candidatus Fermentithermobacillaceae bacterium]